MAFQLPKQSRFMLKIAPSNEWSWNELLLNKMGYYLQVLAWQNTEDAHKKSPQNAPELWWPDFMPKQEKPHSDEVAMEIDDLKAFLSKPRS